MTSPICTVNGNTTGNGVNVAANSAVTIAIADTAGVKSWSLRCISTDENHVAATISAGISIDQITKTATFTSPNVTTGAALIFESEVNGGLDVNGRKDPSLTTRFGVFVLTSPGSLRVGAFDETTEGDASFGWTSKFNAAVRAAGTAGLTPTISGTLPITVNNSNPAAPVIGINAATSGAAGSMSSADKSKLDTLFPITAAGPITFTNVFGTRVIGIEAAGPATRGTMSSADKQKLDDATDVAAPGKLVLYTASSGICVDNVTACSGNNLTLSSDGFADVTLDGQSTGNLLVPSGIRSSVYMFIADTAPETRSIPLDWSACKVGGVESWSINDVSDIVNDVADAFANLSIECHFQHGMHVRKVQIRNKGAGSGGDPLPANPPSFTLYRKNIATGAAAVLGTVNATLDGTYRGNFRTTEIDLTVGGTVPAGHTVDSESYRYYIAITPEFGANALAGCMVRGAFVDRYFPAGFVVGQG